MLHQLSLALLFYLVFSLFAAIGAPFIRRFPDNRVLAYTASKLLGLIIAGYAVWLLCELHLLDYQNRFALIVILALAMLAGIGAGWRGLSLPGIRSAVILEGMALAIYISYLLLRSHNAAINGTERFMDMAMLTASGKTHFFPFTDPWYAGKTVNYYYYGYYLISLLSNLTQIPYALSYNFALGIIYAMSVLLIASLTYAMTESRMAAALAAFLATSAGMLFFTGCTLRAFLSGNVCYWASSTRLYTPSYTIREIPSYSFTVGDLHPHLMALPFFLLGLTLIRAFIKAATPSADLCALLALAFATSGMINSWDMITLAALGGTGLLVKSLRNQPAGKSWLAFSVSLAVAGSLIWPYVRDFQSPVLGLGFAPLFVRVHHLQNIEYPTPVPALLGMWGVFFAGLALSLKPLEQMRNGDIFSAALWLTSLGIIIGVDLVFVRDIYSVANPPHFRANTTFKFGYHAWVMLCIAFAAAMSRLFCQQDAGKLQKAGAGFLVTLAVAGGLFYPYQAIKQFYLSNHAGLTLDGAAWMKQSDPGDYATVDYINRTFEDRTIIAEAVGQSYSTHARITAYTGMITPMGWQTHEWTWRFHLGEPGHPTETGWAAVAQIGGDIRTLYETVDVTQAAQILKRYHIDYVYVGDMERTDYPGLQEGKFYALGQLVFSAFNSRLYKITPDYKLQRTTPHKDIAVPLTYSPIGFGANCAHPADRKYMLTSSPPGFVYMRAFGCPPSAGRFFIHNHGDGATRLP